MLESKRFGKVAVYKVGQDDWPDKALIMGCGASTGYDHQVPAYLFCKYQVWLVDPPGEGNSTGKSLPQRSDQVFVEGGQAELINFVMKQCNIENVVFAGYDSGAAAGLKMALRDCKKFRSIIAFHPSYTEEEKDELKKLKTPVLLQWVKQDQFHNWNKFKPLANKMPRCTQFVMDVKKFNAEMSKSTWKSQSDRITASIVHFLTGVDYSKTKQEVTQSK